MALKVILVDECDYTDCQQDPSWDYTEYLNIYDLCKTTDRRLTGSCPKLFLAK